MYQSGSGLGALVGVGTTNPTSNLQVYGTPIAAGNVFSVLNTAASGNVAQFSSSAGTALIINSIGNVGIGTTNPTSNLQVVGNVLSGNVISSVAMYGVLAGSNTVAASTVTATSLIGTHYGATVGSNTVSSSNVLVASGLPASIIQGSNVFVFSNAYGFANVMVMNSIGNVGIGTTSPAMTLDVYGGIRCAVNGSTTSAEGNNNCIIAYAPGGISGNASIWMGFDPTNDCGYINSARSGLIRPVCLQTRGGNVGIGTVSPAGRLSVVTSGDTSYGPGAWDSTVVTIGQSATSTSSCVGIGYNNTSNWGILLSLGPSVAWREMKYQAYFHSFHVNGGATPSVTIGTGGNLGIGTTSPSLPLDVLGGVKVNNSNQTTALSIQPDGSDYYGSIIGKSITWDGTYYNIYSDGSNRGGAAIQMQWRNIAFYTYGVSPAATNAQLTPTQFNAYQRMTITAGGNVGIGTASPARKLHVYDASTSGAGPFVVDQFATSGFTDCVTLFRSAQAASSSWVACFMQASSGGNTIFGVRGDGYVWAANDITAFSDERVKTNLQKIEGALDKVSNINGYTFTRTDYTSENDKDKRHVGVIAQEIQKVLPELVHEDDKGMLSVAYGNMTALLIEAIKEERQKREVLEERLLRLEKLLLKE